MSQTIIIIIGIKCSLQLKHAGKDSQPGRDTTSNLRAELKCLSKK